MSETWKAIPGLEGRYEVSDQGRVRSTGFYAPVSGGGVRWASPKERKPSVKKKSGHLYFMVRGCVVYVHRAVLEAFVGPCPPGLEGCHGDGVETNNRLSNLRWDTRKANVADCIRHGRFYEGDKHHKAKLTAQTVRWARSQYAEGCSGLDLATYYGVHFVTMYEALRGKTWVRA